MTIHAEEEMDEDELTIFDIESALLNGSIVVRQKDASTGEWKYIVRGSSLDDDDVVSVVCKFGPTEKLVIITVYAERS
jgi:hypothetical protein